MDGEGRGEGGEGTGMDGERDGGRQEKDMEGRERKNGRRVDVERDGSKAGWMARGMDIKIRSILEHTPPPPPPSLAPHAVHPSHCMVGLHS